MRAARHARHGGFSLLEVLISMAMLGAFMGSLILVLSRGTQAANAGMVHQSLEGRARRTLDRLASTLIAAVAETLDPDPVAPFGGSTLSFQNLAGLEEGEVQWGTLAQIALGLDDGELDDGTDNNSNGLIDERKIVFTLDPEGEAQGTAVWAHGVSELLEGEIANGIDDNENGLKDEAGLSFQHSGGRLILRLSLEEMDRGGTLLVRTLETTVRLRN